MARLDKHDWLEGALALLGTGSIESVKVEPLAKSLGVTKGSFYWHFDDRAALLRALLDYWVEAATERVIELVEEQQDPEASPDPVAALHRLLDLSLGTPDEGDAVETAIRAWAATDPEAAAVTAAVDERRLGYVTDLLVAAGVDRAPAAGRSHVIYRVLIGEYLWRRYGGEPLDLAAVHDLIDRLAVP